MLFLWYFFSNETHSLLSGKEFNFFISNNHDLNGEIPLEAGVQGNARDQQDDHKDGGGHRDDH